MASPGMAFPGMTFPGMTFPGEMKEESALAHEFTTRRRLSGAALLHFAGARGERRDDCGGPGTSVLVARERLQHEVGLVGEDPVDARAEDQAEFGEPVPEVPAG
jgi:hypothetical protein